MFKVNNKDTRTTRRSAVFIVKFEHISSVLSFNIFHSSSAFIINFEQVNASWVRSFWKVLIKIKQLKSLMAVLLEPKN